MYQRVVPDAIPCTKQGANMGDKPFIKFYPSDFLGGTSGLTPAERGVYMTLICLIYEADGPIPRDDGRLARRCGSPKAAFVRSLDCLIDEGKITEEGGMLSNNRAEKAIVDRQNRTQSATHAAKSKWSAQKEKTVSNQGKDDAVAMPTQCACDASQRPEPEPEKEYTHPKGCATGKPASGFWNDCILFLEGSGRSNRQARSLLGKWRKDHGERAIRDAIAKARASPDPIAYIETALRPKPKQRTTAEVLKGM